MYVHSGLVQVGFEAGSCTYLGWWEVMLLVLGFVFLEQNDPGQNSTVKAISDNGPSWRAPGSLDRGGYLRKTEAVAAEVRDGEGICRELQNSSRLGKLCFIESENGCVKEHSLSL